MDIVVCGAGAIGGFLGGQLALAGHQVTLIDRPAAAAALNRDGLRITRGGATLTAPVKAVGAVAEAPLDSAGLIVLATKAYDLAAALDELRAACPRPAQLLSTQNGIGIEEMLVARFGADRVLAGTVTVPISRAGANRLTVEREGRGLGIAPVRAGRAVEDWVGLFAAAGIRAAALVDYRAMKWSKAFLNVMGNAVSAILNRPPGELYRMGAVFDLEMRMLREMLAVMKQLGIAPVNLPGATLRPLALSLGYAPRFLLRAVFTQVVVRGRGDKMPSFHIDLTQGRGRSEVVYHNGAIAAAGRDCGVATPVNSAYNDLLLALSRGERSRAEFDGRPDRLLAEVARFERGA